MLIPPPGRWIGFCVVGCVLALFFFPLAHGSFQATHGPTTALRARRQIFGIIRAMVRTFLCALARVLPTASFVLDGLPLNLRGPGSSMAAALTVAILRC